MHSSQVSVEFLTLDLLSLGVFRIVSHLRVKQLLTFHLIYNGDFVFVSLLVADGIHHGGLVLDPLECLFVLVVSFVFGYLIYQVLHAMVL